MMKIKLEEIELSYKNVAELHVKLQTHLGHVRSKKLRTAEELRSLTRQERALKKFLGVQRNEQQDKVAIANG